MNARPPLTLGAQASHSPSEGTPGWRFLRNTKVFHCCRPASALPSLPHEACCSCCSVTGSGSWRRCSQDLTASLWQLITRGHQRPRLPHLYPAELQQAQGRSLTRASSPYTEPLGELRTVITARGHHAEREPAPALPATTPSGTSLGPTWSPWCKRRQKGPTVRKRCKNPPSYKNFPTCSS